MKILWDITQCVFALSIMSVTLALAAYCIYATFKEFKKL